MKKPGRKISRRSFLLAMGAGGAAATAALVSTREEQPSKKTEAVSGSKSYRLTEHIQNYYRTAKV